jgi:hypothetical protein
MLGALVDRSDNLLMKAAADVDEIDMASSDTFLPWSPEFFEDDPLRPRIGKEERRGKAS